MSKKVLILSGSPNRNGNSDLLCEEFKKGAEDAGNQVEKIFIREKKIGYCVACQFCKHNGAVGPCAIKDDMAEIMEKMQAADVIVMASPVYFYGINAQMKTVIDRTYCGWMELKNKELYYILSCADTSDASNDMAAEHFKGWEICLPGAVCKGKVFAKGVNGPGEVKETSYMQEAYEMGKNI